MGMVAATQIKLRPAKIEGPFRGSRAFGVACHDVFLGNADPPSITRGRGAMNTPLLRADYPNDESQAEVGPEVTSNLPSLIELLRYRIGTIISVTVVTLIALAAIDWSIAPRYTAETLVLIDNRQDKVVNIESVLSGLPTDQPSILNQIQIIKSPTLAARVIAKLHLDTD
jgi:hypothetical protein